VTSLLAYLKKPKKEHEQRMFESMFRNANQTGEFFLNAIHCHRQGFTNEANEIVALLFEKAKDPHKVIKAGLGRLAGVQFDEVTRRFFAGGTWQSYHDELNGLSAKYGKNWPQTPAVDRLTGEIKEHMAREAVPVPEGEGLSDEDLRMAAELSAASNPKQWQAYHVQSRIWVLPPGEEGMLVPPADTNILGRIRDRRLDAVPLLLALLKDDSLTRINLQTLTGRSYGSFGSISFSGGYLSDEILERTYNQMARPATRGDIAAFFLNPLPLRDEDRGYREPTVDKELLYEECQEWYEENKDKSPLDLARLYMEEGNRNQRQAGLQTMMQVGDASDLEIIEKAFLESENPMQEWNVVNQYVLKRGPKAREFVDKYIARLKAWEESGGDGENGLFRQAIDDDWVERIEKSLEQAVSSKSLEDLLADLASGKTTWVECNAVMMQKMQDREPEEVLGLILGTALEVDEPKTRTEILGTAPQVQYAARGRRRGGAAFQPAKLDIATHADKWKKLLEDDRSAGGAFGYQFEQMGTVADTVAAQVEALYQSGGLAHRRADPSHVLGQRVQDLVRKRALARLEGKTGDDLPSYPSADEVSEARREEMLAGIKAAASVDALRTLIAGFSLDELLALVELGQDDEELNVKLAGPAHTITKVTVELPSEEDTGLVKALQDKQLAKEHVESLVEMAKRLSTEGHIFAAVTWRRPGLEGISLDVRLVDPEDKDSNVMSMMGGYWGMEASSQQAMVMAMLSGSGLHAQGMWAVKSGDEEEKDEPKVNPLKAQLEAMGMTDELPMDMLDELDADLDSQWKAGQDEFWKQLEKLCEGKDNVCMNGMVYVWGTPAQEEDEEDAKRDRRRGSRATPFIYDLF